VLLQNRGLGPHRGQARRALVRTLLLGEREGVELSGLENPLGARRSAYVVRRIGALEVELVGDLRVDQQRLTGEVEAGIRLVPGADLLDREIERLGRQAPSGCASLNSDIHANRYSRREIYLRMRPKRLRGAEVRLRLCRFWCHPDDPSRRPPYRSLSLCRHRYGVFTKSSDTGHPMTPTISKLINPVPAETGPA
jgi:hypothetical protein